MGEPHLIIGRPSCPRLPFLGDTASAATTLATRELQVATRERMSFRAFGFASIDPGQCQTAHQIFAGSNRLKMIGVHTGGCETKVVNNEAIWDWAFEQYVSKLMRRDGFLLNP